MMQLLRKTPLHAFYQRSKFRHWGAEDEKRLAFYRQFISPGDLVYDVGANVGNRTKVFLKLGARVVAFEPQQSCADLLENVLQAEANFRLVRKALGAAAGTATMLVSDASVLSTLSEEWITASKQNGRLSDWNWNQKQTVEVTTLDDAIASFGRPTFIKIDVEGFEHEVVSGLTSPVAGISFEFLSELLPKTLLCIDHLSRLGETASFQLSCGESMHFEVEAWVPAYRLKDILGQLIASDPLAWGDIYFRSKV